MLRQWAILQNEETMTIVKGLKKKNVKIDLQHLLQVDV